MSQGQDTEMGFTTIQCVQVRVPCNRWCPSPNLGSRKLPYLTVNSLVYIYSTWINSSQPRPNLAVSRISSPNSSAWKIKTQFIGWINISKKKRTIIWNAADKKTGNIGKHFPGSFPQKAPVVWIILTQKEDLLISEWSTPEGVSDTSKNSGRL